MYFLQELLKTAEGMDPATIKPVTTQVPDGAHIAGVLDDNLKRLWMARCHYTDAFNMATEKFQEQIPATDNDAGKKDLTLIKVRADIANDSFWTEVRLQFQEKIPADPGQIGLAGGLQVYWQERNEMPQRLTGIMIISAAICDDKNAPTEPEQP